MRTLTKVAMASVVVAGVCGVLHNGRGDHPDIAVRTSESAESQLVRQGVDQKDQNLKLLIAAKIFAVVDEAPERNDRVRPQGRADSPTSAGRPSS